MLFGSKIRNLTRNCPTIKSYADRNTGIQAVKLILSVIVSEPTQTRTIVWLPPTQTFKYFFRIHHTPKNESCSRRPINQIPIF